MRDALAGPHAGLNEALDITHEAYQGMHVAAGHFNREDAPFGYRVWASPVPEGLGAIVVSRLWGPYLGRN